jgi:hypothetical protein
MIPKVEACLRGLEGVPRTHIIDGRLPHALIRDLFTDEGVGTMIFKLGAGPGHNGAGRSRPHRTTNAWTL